MLFLMLFLTPNFAIFLSLGFDLRGFCGWSMHRYILGRSSGQSDGDRGFKFCFSGQNETHNRVAQGIQFMEVYLEQTPSLPISAHLPFFSFRAFVYFLSLIASVSFLPLSLSLSCLHACLPACLPACQIFTWRFTLCRRLVGHCGLPLLEC